MTFKENHHGQKPSSVFNFQLLANLAPFTYLMISIKENTEDYRWKYSTMILLTCQDI